MNEPIIVATPQNTVLVIGTAAVIINNSRAAWLHQKILGRNRIPTKWRKVGEVREMIIYPLKSGTGVNLQEAVCTDLGLQSIGQDTTQLLDRTFLVFGSEDRTYMTAARFPKMVLITITPETDGNVLFKAPGMPTLRYKIPDSTKDELSASTCIVWWSEKCRQLTVEKEQQHGSHNTSWHYKKLRDRDVGAYSYLTGFMLLTDSSIADLESRLPQRLRNLSHRRFRGNFIVKDTIPYEEDTWDWVRVGEEAIFRTVKPCTRCVIINVDPDTAERDPQLEPLRTLRSYRLVTKPGAKDVEGPDPIMGVYLGLRIPGVVKE
ncbi:hypothetical protein L9F63_024927, partial [Diploptera punctata]